MAGGASVEAVVMHWELFEKVVDARRAHECAREAYLTATGWEHTSDNPDCCWRWEKEIKGKITSVSTETAISIQRNLDKMPYEGRSEHPEGYNGPCGCDLCMSYA